MTLQVMRRIGLGSLVGLFIAETSTLFGFSEGTLETPMLIAIVAEAAAVLLLAPVAVASLARISLVGGGARSPHALRSS